VAFLLELVIIVENIANALLAQMVVTFLGILDDHLLVSIACHEGVYDAILLLDPLTA
jgi:hypothetical protein